MSDEPIVSAAPAAAAAKKSKAKAPDVPDSSKKRIPQSRQFALWIAIVVLSLLCLVLAYGQIKYSGQITGLEMGQIESKTRLEGKDLEISRLQAEVQRQALASNARPDLTDQLKQAQEQLASAQSAADKQRQELEEKIRVLQTKLPDTTNSTVLWDTLPASLQDQAKSLGFTRDGLKGDDTRTIRLSADNDRLTSENKSIDQKLRALETEIARLKAEHEQALKDLTEANLSKTKTDGQLNLSKDILAARDQTITDLKKEGDSLRLRIQESEKFRSQDQVTAQTSLKAAETTIQSLHQQIKELEAALKSAKESPPGQNTAGP